MKPTRFLPIVVAVLVCISGCDKSTQRVTELERKASEALARQQELEQQLEDQRLAAERDAIERERLQIEEARAALEQQQQENASAEAETLRQREEELARREGKVQQAEITLQEQVTNIGQRDVELSERDRELAGREALATEEPNYQGNGPVADYGMFYDSLSSYGSWFETPDYGYVWQPVVVREVSWRPYTRGRWVCSDYGWTWLSDEPFGWATYHYGRWALLRGHGWVWVPGSEWAPSWVSWRSSGDCIGWAPLPPETLAWRGQHWGNTVDVTFGIGALWFSFVEYRNFGEPVHRHCLPYGRNRDYYHQTINITNIHVKNRRVVCGGPGYEDIRRKGGKSLKYYQLDVDRHGRPGRDSLAMRPRIEDGRLRIAAPNVDAEWNEGLKPSKIKRRLENVTVERPEPLKPEIAENFRKSREQNRAKAEETVAQLGGREAFNQRRLEKLEANRRQFAEQTRDKENKREDKLKSKDQPIPPRNVPKPDDAERTARDGKEQKNRKDQEQQLQSQREKPFQQQPGETQTESPRPEGDKKQQRQLEEAHRQQEQASQQQFEQARRDQERQREQSRKQQPDETTRLQQPEQARGDQELQREQSRKQQLDELRRRLQQPEKAKSESPGPEVGNNARLEQQRQFEEARRQQEQARKQQLEQSRRDQEQQIQQQRGQERQQQLEETRKQQILQQQEQQIQQQREQARQRQMDEARQQQIEQSRREQQRQQEQQIQQQREQSRQRQMEEARQQQQQQIEQSRREQQRQQEQQQRQQDQQRQREQPRDNQRDDDNEKRQRGR